MLQLTLHHTGSPVSIIVSKVMFLFPSPTVEGTSIFFGGGDEDFIMVSETFDVVSRRIEIKLKESARG